MTDLYAGVAKEDISPPKGLNLIGYGNRYKGNEGIHDPLFATALVLGQDEIKVALVTCDLLAISDDTRQLIQSQIDYPVLICCSHTHAGPITHADETSPGSYHNYVNILVNKIVTAIQEAEAQSEAITLHYSQGEAHIAVNRREQLSNGRIIIGQNLTGMVDRDLSVLVLRSQSGPDLATLVNYACHPVVLGAKNHQASADWVGPMRAYVESQTQVPCLFIQGACADLNPYTMHNFDRRWQDLDRLGQEVGHAVVKRLASLVELESAPLSHQSQILNLALESDRNNASYQIRLAKMVNRPSQAVDAVLNRLFPWKVAVDHTENGDYVPLQTNLLRIGDLALVCLGAEIFTELGLAIKAASPAKHTLIAGVSNGCISYVPTASAHTLGGYEINTAPFFFRLPARFKSGVGEQVVQASIEHLKNLF